VSDPILPISPALPVAVRPARPADAPAIVRFQVAMAAETEELALEPAVVARGVDAVFADRAKGEYFVAEDDRGTVVGGLLVTPEWSDWRAGTWWWIQSVYVVPEMRGRGVYAALYGSVRRTVEERPELVGIRLYVADGNRQALEVYRRLGMIRDHYDMFYWRKGG
jgi:GNAT superfamily N-acetyltransferase